MQIQIRQMIIFAASGIVGIILAALGYRFTVSFLSATGVLLFGILTEGIIAWLGKKKLVSVEEILS